MALLHRVTPSILYQGSLPRNADLLDEMTGLCRSTGALLGRIEAIGAVQKARLGFYDQDRREYRHFDLNRPLEITSLLGNVSLRDGEPFVHAHLTLADRDGCTYGGHLAQGTIVFACEFFLELWDGEPLERRFDDATGLYLWDSPSR